MAGSSGFYPLSRFFVEDRGGGVREVVVRVEKLVCFGWSGRDREEVLKHVEELSRLGVPRPRSIPEMFVVPPYLLYSGDFLEVYTEFDSGEVEYVLVFDEEGRVYVGVGSDHTDRVLERLSVEKSKQVYPKVVASRLWMYSDVVDHWDELVLRSWARRGGRLELYQEGRLASLVRPEELVERVGRFFEKRNLVVFSGTIPTVGGEVYSSDYFVFELYDPVLGRRIRHSYSVRRVVPR